MNSNSGNLAQRRGVVLVNIDKENVNPHKKEEKSENNQVGGKLLTVLKERVIHTDDTTPSGPSQNLASYVSSLPESFCVPNTFQCPPPTMSMYPPPSQSYLMPLSPPFSPQIPPPVYDFRSTVDGIKAVVDEGGWISLYLRHGVVLDISDKEAIRVRNNVQNSALSLSSCTTQMALVHPKGRLLQYGPRIEVQVEDNVSVKNAKLYPKGISFTANNCALVYLLDEAGARTTSDMFHDLYANQITDSLFLESCARSGPRGVGVCVDQLENAQYWRSDSGVDYWIINQVKIQQTRDGLVTVERETEGDYFLLKTSPGNGKVRFDSRLVQVTASLGEESHLFLRSMEKRLHYSGQSSVFTVRNAGHSAGFDEEGMLRIF